MAAEPAALNPAMKPLKKASLDRSLSESIARGLGIGSEALPSASSVVVTPSTCPLSTATAITSTQVQSDPSTMVTWASVALAR